MTNINNINEQETIVDEILKIHLVKGIYKLHKNDDFLLLPIIKKLAIKTYRKLSKNKLFFTNFNKDFLIDNNLIYLSNKIEQKIENYIKNNKIGFILDLIVILFFIDLSVNNDSELNKIKWKIWNKLVNIVYKKVKNNLEKFITKDTIFTQNILWFKINDKNQKRLFFSTWTAKEIRAIKTQNKEQVSVLDLEATIMFLKQVKEKTSIYNNIIIYTLLVEALEIFNIIKNTKESNSNDYKQSIVFINVMINTFVWTVYINKEFFEKLWFNVKTELNIEHMSEADIDALKTFIKNYYSLLIKDIITETKNSI